jgi:hypothetical protein
MKYPDCAEPVIGRRFAPTRWLHPGYKIGVRQKSNLLKRIKVIWVVQSCIQKYSAS